MSKNSGNAHKQTNGGSQKNLTEKVECSFSIIEWVSQLGAQAEGEVGFLNPNPVFSHSTFVTSVTLYLFVSCSLLGITTLVPRLLGLIKSPCPSGTIPWGTCNNCFLYIQEFKLYFVLQTFCHPLEVPGNTWGGFQTRPKNGLLTRCSAGLRS